jgi:hypothetical protein
MMRYGLLAVVPFSMGKTTYLYAVSTDLLLFSMIKRAYRADRTRIATLEMAIRAPTSDEPSTPDFRRAWILPHKTSSKRGAMLMELVKTLFHYSIKFGAMRGQTRQGPMS